MHAVLSEDEVTMMDGYPDTDSAGSVSWRTCRSPLPPGALPTEFCISHSKGKAVDPLSSSIRFAKHIHMDAADVGRWQGEERVEDGMGNLCPSQLGHVAHRGGWD